MFSVDMLVRDRLQNAQQLMPIRAKTRVPLKCFISGKKLQNPACTSGCTHPERVELTVFFEHVQQTGKWVCPICGIATNYASVLVDKLIREVLIDLGTRDVDEVEVFQTHEWMPVRKLTDTHVIMQQVLKLKGERAAGQREASITETYTTKKRRDTRMMSFRAVTMGMRTSSNAGRGVTKASARVQPSPVYWFPWNEPFAYRYNMEDMSFDRILGIYNISFLVLQATLLYQEAGLHCIGGVNHQYISQSSVLFLSENIGVRKCASMQKPRHSFPAVYFADYIYVFGGLTIGGLTDSCERMKLDAQVWEPAADLSEPRAAASAVVLSKYVYLVGGSTVQLPYSSEVERFAPLENSWSVMRVHLPYGLVNHLTFPLPNRPAFLVLGGYGEFAEGRDVLLVNVHDNHVMADLPKLKTSLTDTGHFPIMSDPVSSVLHLLSGDGVKEPVSHSYYHIDSLLKIVPEGEELASPPSKSSQFITPSTKSEINASVS